jgi:hypothetical protein
LREIRGQVSRDGADERCLVGWFVVEVSDLRSSLPFTWKPEAHAARHFVKKKKRLPRNGRRGPAFFPNSPQSPRQRTSLFNQPEQSIQLIDFASVRTT